MKEGRMKEGRMKEERRKFLPLLSLLPIAYCLFSVPCSLFPLLKITQMPIIPELSA
jgi:hypothetical protein